jgi:hypothetical protein
MPKIILLIPIHLPYLFIVISPLQLILTDAMTFIGIFLNPILAPEILMDLGLTRISNSIGLCQKQMIVLLL